MDKFLQECNCTEILAYSKCAHTDLGAPSDHPSWHEILIIIIIIIIFLL